MIELDNTGIILLSCLCSCFFIQMIYYWIFFAKPLRYQKKMDREQLEPESEMPSVSVVICAKNESGNLLRFLPSVLEQDYPQYEVVVVNDGSTDESDEVLGRLEGQYNHLYRTYIPENAKYLSRKKLAMTVGVKASKNDVLLFTEADCEPVTKDWIRLMVRNFENEKTVVLGLNVMSKSQGFFTKFAAFDSFFHSLQYLSLALFNRPYKGSGRNMAYRKELFFNQKGYSKFLNLQAGEDDLFINQVSTKKNTKVELSPESITVTHLESMNAWKEMKISQATTQRYYKSGPIAFWRFELYIRCCFLGLCVASIIYGLPGFILPVTAGMLFLMRLSSQLLIINRMAVYLRLEKFYLTLPLFDLFQPVFNFYFYIYRLFRGKKDYTWG